MNPSFANKNRGDAGLSNAEFVSDGLLAEAGLSQCANLPDVAICQLGKPMLFTPWQRPRLSAPAMFIASWHKTLLCSIGKVVRACAFKQVGRSDASFYIAMMTSKQPFMNWATKFYLKSKTMRGEMTLVFFESWISISRGAASPEPARLRFFNLSPELFVRHNIAVSPLGR